MTSRILPISALLGGVALLLLGSGLLGTLLAVRGGLEGFGTGVIGLVMSCYFVGFLLGTVVAPAIIGRVGHIRAFAIFAAVASCTAVLHAMWVEPWFWGLLRVLTGIAVVGLYNVIESWLTAQANSESRGSVFAVYMIVNLMALAAGQWLILAGSPTSFELFSLITILVALSLVPVAMTQLGQPSVSDAKRVSYWVIQRAAPVAVVGGFGSGLVMGAFWGMGPLFAQRIGLDERGVAALMSLTIVGGALLQLPVGRYSDNHDRRRVMGEVAAGGALMAVVAALLLERVPMAIFPMMLLYGGMAFAIYPLCAAHLSDWLESDQLIGGSSWLLLLHGAGAALGPVLAGWFMGMMGPGSLLLFFAALLVPIAWFAGWYALPRRADATIAGDQSSNFVPMVRTSAAVMELLAEDEASEPSDEWMPDADAELEMEAEERIGAVLAGEATAPPAPASEDPSSDEESPPSAYGHP